MKRALLLCVLSLSLAAGVLAQAPKPILLTGPEAEGRTLAAALETVHLAKQHGYNGVSLGLGINRIDSPTNINYNGVRDLTREAMAQGLTYVCWRLELDVPSNAAWATLNGGQTWTVPTRPPSGTWSKIAQIWQAARDVAATEVVAAGKNPATALMFVMTNEPGIGGTNAPSYDAWGVSGFYYALYQQTGDVNYFLLAMPQEFLGKPEGYIEPGFWTMLRSIRQAVNFGGSRVYAVSFEGAETSLVGQINSVVGPDAEWLYANCTGFALNIFTPNLRPLFDSLSGTMTRPALTPVQSASAFKKRLDTMIGQLRSNPILANEGLILTEFNAAVNRVPEFVDPYPYRMEVLRSTMNHTGLDGAMMFTGINFDLSSSAFQLFERVRDSNGVFVIRPIGSHAVGPAYLGP